MESKTWLQVDLLILTHSRPLCVSDERSDYARKLVFDNLSTSCKWKAKFNKFKLTNVLFNTTGNFYKYFEQIFISLSSDSAFLRTWRCAKQKQVSKYMLGRNGR